MRVLIRADGDSAMGTGHVMRMLALAQWLAQDGGDGGAGTQVIFASVRLSPQLETRLRAQGIPVERAELTEGSTEDSAWTRGLIAAHGCDWLVCDGYHFADAFQTAIHQAGIRQLVIDDYGHCQQQIAELVVNQNASASEAFYPRRAGHTELLLGTQYVLLRREFVAAAPAARTVSQRADRILVTLGGADPANTTASIAASLRAIPDPALRVSVVFGP
ncbi:MAG TPA: hypothetical protein VK509_14255, partial [Polyangiales bacterium]|nr:hypothetical protein [Polyangiales bacterium]